MLNRLKELWCDESGVSAIEYALIASGIAMAILASITALSDAVSVKFNEITTELGGTPPAATPK